MHNSAGFSIVIDCSNSVTIWGRPFEKSNETLATYLSGFEKIRDNTSGSHLNKYQLYLGTDTTQQCLLKLIGRIATGSDAIVHYTASPGENQIAIKTSISDVGLQLQL